MRFPWGMNLLGRPTGNGLQSWMVTIITPFSHRARSENYWCKPKTFGVTWRGPQTPAL
jgi:hypothetical protein